MYGFILKKNFCDTWDNLFSCVIINAIFTLTLVGTLLLAGLVQKSFGESDTISTIIILAIFLVGFYLMVTFALAYGELAVKIADFRSARLVDFFIEIPGVLKDAAFLTIFLALVTFVSAYCIDFYIVQTQSKTGLFVGAMLFWVDVFIFLALQWFIPIRSTFHNNFLKCLKKCFIVFMDNTWYTILTTLNGILLFALSIVFIGFVPGMTGISIALHNAFRIRLYKYDYLEEHPELKTKKERSQIPWEDLIYDDRETLGPRKLKSFLFPWKED